VYELTGDEPGTAGAAHDTSRLLTRGMTRTSCGADGGLAAGTGTTATGAVGSEAPAALTAVTRTE
jgi:hypothetical protein